MKKKILTAMSLLLLTTPSVQADVVRRAAFDLGSGKMKMQVVDFDTETNRIIKVICREQAMILLAEDLAVQGNNKLSQKAQDSAVAAMCKMKELALSHGVTEFAGIATSAYRQAHNGQQLVDRYKNELSIPVTIISADHEGRLAFSTLVAEKQLNPDQIVCWDIGGGSFQITYLDENGQIKFFADSFGRVSTKNHVITHVKKRDPQLIRTPNPMSAQDWENSLRHLQKTLPQPPEDLVRKLKREDVLLIGVCAHPKQLTKLGSYSQNDVIKARDNLLHKTDQELAKSHTDPSFAITDLALIYHIMQVLDIHRALYLDVFAGSTSGLLTAKEFWGNIRQIVAEKSPTR